MNTSYVLLRHRLSSVCLKDDKNGKVLIGRRLKFEIVNYSDNQEKQPVRELVRSQLTPQIRTKLACFGEALIEQHGKDIQHTEENDPKYKSSLAPVNPSSSSHQPENLGSSVTQNHSQISVVNTTEIKDAFEFQTSADELYETFTDTRRVAAFTRSPPEIFKASNGGAFKLFGGNVEGEFITLTPSQSIVQKWRLSSWPKGMFFEKYCVDFLKTNTRQTADHYSTMTINFDQGTDTTFLRLGWEGVPIGQEETTRKNFEEYYVKSIKRTFG
ncbi:hypothetical protein ABW20_dc0109545 [Dactylellina cionopaga]|nr:hypothetical protein ABW20_dc0109545 [Dactylellina cionopaga]